MTNRIKIWTDPIAPSEEAERYIQNYEKKSQTDMNIGA
jgi:hypothetical protein